MTFSSAAIKFFAALTLVSATCAISACSSTSNSALPSSALPAGTAPAPIQPQAKPKTGFVISLTPPSMTYLHANAPSQTITIVVADERPLTVVVQDPTVASAVLNPGYIVLPAGGGFQETITVTPQNPGITNLFVNTKDGIVATVPLDIYGQLQAAPVAGTTIQCKNPDSCTATSTAGGASVNFAEPFYPNSYTVSADTCQTTTGATTFGIGGTYSLQLTSAGYDQLVDAAIEANSLTESLTCTTTVSATETVPTTETFTVTFQSLQRGGGL